jgi:hypothetical protein
MARPLPGTMQIEGREFMYLEYEEGRNFSDLIYDLMTSNPTIPLPQSGGILEEKARIKLPDETSLLAISFKGDLEGWRNKIVSFCAARHSRWALLRTNALLVSDGSVIPLIKCEISLDA